MGQLQTALGAGLITEVSALCRAGPGHRISALPGAYQVPATLQIGWGRGCLSGFPASECSGFEQLRRHRMQRLTTAAAAL
ncbi:hypothetical protein BXOR1_14300 [Xanthomonas oryzae pv. oryzicola]|nr:hypothetical protein BXOR1_14300 [Xanthomonas oryzae pv. oryzicola]